MTRYKPEPPPEPSAQTKMSLATMDALQDLADRSTPPEEQERIREGYQVGDWLRQMRCDANATLAVLAERAGCSVAWICAIESGKSLPHPALMTKMALVLGADPFEGSRRLLAEQKRRKMKGNGVAPYMTQADRTAYGQSQRLMVLRSVATRLLVYGVSTSADDVGADMRIAYHTARNYLDDLVARGDARLLFPEHGRRQWTITAQGISRACIGDWAPPLEQACDLWPAMLRLFVQRDRAETRAHEDALKSREALEKRLTLQEIADGAPLPPVPGVLARMRVTDDFPVPPPPLPHRQRPSAEDRQRHDEDDRTITERAFPRRRT